MKERGQDREPSADGSESRRRPPDEGVEVRRLRRRADARGAVFEPLGADELARQRNVHVVLTEPGSVRGNHVHGRGTEILVVEGPARVRYRPPGGLREVEVGPEEVVSFTFPPGVAHAVLATGTRPNLLVTFRDRPHDPDDPDTEPVRLFDLPTGGGGRSPG